MRALWRAALRLRGAQKAASATPPLLFFTDPHRTPLPASIVPRLPRGAGLVYRPFGAIDRLHEGKKLASACRSGKVMFLVGGDPGLAARLGARGLHLPERDSGRAGDIRRWRRRFLVTAAAHDAPAVLRACRAGVEAVVISPAFASASLSAGRPHGARRLAQLARLASAPAVALGGVNRRTISRLALTGVGGVAMVEAVVGDLSDGKP